MTNGEKRPGEENFDCIEFKRRAQAEIYEATKDMTHAEEIAYVRKRVDESWVGDWWRSIKGASETVHETPPESAEDKT